MMQSPGCLGSDFFLPQAITYLTEKGFLLVSQLITFQ
jgi:hypothetical protein